MKKNHKIVSEYFRLNDKRRALLTSFLFLVMIMFGSAAYGQNVRTIKGKVTDANQEPLIGATIMQKDKGASSATVTDVNGRFTINVSGAKQILVASYIGMESKEVDVLGKDNITIVLSDQNVNIDEVVVVGYGNMKKSDISGSVVSVNKEQMMKKSPTNILEGLKRCCCRCYGYSTRWCS